jgi:hypothetical protein
MDKTHEAEGMRWISDFSLHNLESCHKQTLDSDVYFFMLLVDIVMMYSSHQESSMPYFKFWFVQQFRRLGLTGLSWIYDCKPGHMPLKQNLLNSITWRIIYIQMHNPHISGSDSFAYLIHIMKNPISVSSCDSTCGSFSPSNVPRFVLYFFLLRKINLIVRGSSHIRPMLVHKHDQVVGSIPSPPTLQLWIQPPIQGNPHTSAKFTQMKSPNQVNKRSLCLISL